MLLVVAIHPVACKSGESDPERSRVGPRASSCPIDGVTLGLYGDGPLSPECIDESVAACEDACREGDPAACVEVAYAIEQDPRTEPRAQQLYTRACSLGHHNACTNRAAYLYHQQSASAEQKACAARMFEATCESGEPFGCGMYSLALHYGTGIARDADAALVHAGRTCQQTEHFACDALGQIYEARGELAKAVIAFTQACETGYDDACADAERIGAARK